MRIVFGVVLVCGVVLSGPVFAQRMSNLTGAKLVELCGSKDPRALDGCTAYIDGIADTVAFYQRLRPADGSRGAALPGYVCIPGPVTGVQLRQAVIEWFGKNRDQGQRQASGVVLRAFDEKWPCPGEAKPVAPAAQ